MNTNRYSDIEIKSTDISNPDAAKIMSELSASLFKITGNSGESSFNIQDFDNKSDIFVIAYCAQEPVGCGALRQIDKKTAEIKRVYAKHRGYNIGKEIVLHLEMSARKLGYAKIVLEARKVNSVASAFYSKLGYSVIDNYGKYKGREDAVCFSKSLY